MADSFFLTIAVTTFALGNVLYFVSISNTSWQGFDEGATISLWKVCYRLHFNKSWLCNSWHKTPDFVRSAQAFCIISLLCCIVCSIILIAAFVLRCLHKSKLALIGLSLLTFTSACMIAMSVIVMGIRGRDYLLEVKQDDEKRFKFLLKGIVISGNYVMGWAMILAIVASLINYISFGFFLLEFKDLMDWREPPSTKV